MEVVQHYNGQLIKVIGDEIMATFPHANNSIQAACLMQEKITQHAATHQLQLGLRVGLNFGPVIHEKSDVFGRTVNIAARMVEFAQSGQIITTQTTVKALDKTLQAQTRLIERLTSPGKIGRMNVYQVIWEQRELTTARTYLAATPPLSAVIHLTFHEQSIVITADDSGFSIGRNADNDLVICDDYTSRIHAKIVYRRGKFILTDTSTNGTFIVLPEGHHAFVHREECVLQNQGWIGIGELRRQKHPDVIYFEVSSPAPAP